MTPRIPTAKREADTVLNLRDGRRYMRRDGKKTGRARLLPGIQTYRFLVDGVEYDDYGVARPGGFRPEANDLISEVPAKRIATAEKARKGREMVAAWGFSVALSGGRATTHVEDHRGAARRKRRYLTDEGYRCGPIVPVALPAPKKASKTK